MVAFEKNVNDIVEIHTRTTTTKTFITRKFAEAANARRQQMRGNEEVMDRRRDSTRREIVNVFLKRNLDYWDK